MSRPPVFLALAALIALAAALLSEVRAADADFPAIDPPGHWRLMTQDPDTTSSKCVGDPKTPLCAVETIRACFIRYDDHLCRIGMDVDHRVENFALHHANEYEKNRIVAVKRISAQDLRLSDTDPKYTHDPDYAPWAWKVGDLKLVLQYIPCWKKGGGFKRDFCGTHIGATTIYVVRKEGAHWRVVDWDTPRID
jgi:hypothetical protein